MNISQGPNSTSQQRRLSAAAINVLTSAYVISFLIALPGNALGLVVVYRRRSFKNTMNLLIMNMCFADFLSMLVVTPWSLAFIHAEGRWIAGVLGDILCKITQYALVVSIAASILTILFISFGRFFAICYPFKRKFFQRPRVVTAWIWVLAMILMFPYAVLYKNHFIRGNWHCSMLSFGQNTLFFMKIHYLLLFIVLYAFPVVLIAALNSIIVFKLAHGHIPGEAHGTSREVAMRFRYRAVKMLITLLALFILCWLPTHMMHYFLTSRRDILRSLPIWVPYLSYWFGHLNSALNPIIYVLLSDNFRRDFKKLFLYSRRMSRTTSCKATTSVAISRERSGSGLGRFSHRLSESLSMKSFPRTPSFRHVKIINGCASPEKRDQSSEKRDQPSI